MKVKGKEERHTMTDICRESEFRKHLEIMTKNTHGYTRDISEKFNSYINSFIEQKFKSFSNEFHQETRNIGAEILKEYIRNCYMPHRYLKSTTHISHMASASPQCVHLDYLLDTVEELKREISIMKSEKAEESAILCLQNDHLMTTINGLKKEVDTLKAVISGKGNVMEAVDTIQRYWRRYLLVKNIKKFASEYEMKMLREFRKSMVNRDSLLSAAKSRIKPSAKVTPSNPTNWSDSKASSIVADCHS